MSDAGLLYAAAIWGSTFYIVKDGLSDASPLTLVSYRFLIAAAVMLAWALITRRNPLKNYSQGFILGAILWCLYLPQTIGLQYTTASNSGFITGLFVAFLPPLYFLFFRKLPTVQRQLAVAISLLGLWFLTGGLVEINIGDMLTLGGALFYALHILAADRFVKKGSDLIVLSLQQFFTVGMLSLILLLMLGEKGTVASAKGWWIILFLALLPTLSAFVIQLYAQKISGPVKVGLIFAMEPLFAAIFAWTLGGEQFIPGRAFGGLLIVAGIIISELPLRRRN